MLVACAPKQASPKEVWIGAALPVTGTYAQMAANMRQTIEQAVKEANASGGINGAELKVRIEDDKMDPKEAGLVAEKLAADNKILAVIGHFASSCTIVGVPIYEKAKLVSVSPGSSSQKLAGISKWFFRACNPTNVQNTMWAYYLVQVLGFKRIASFHSSDEGPTSNAARYIEVAQQLGAEIVAHEAHDFNAKDFTGTLTKIAATKPDVLVYGGMAAFVDLVVPQAREVGYTGPIFTEGVQMDEIIKAVGKAGEGLILYSMFDPNLPNSNAKAFAEKYTADYGTNPSWPEATAYDATNMIIESLRKGGTTRQAVRDYMEGFGSTRDAYTGVTGPIGFGADHDPAKTGVFYQLKGMPNGKPVLLGFYNLKTGWTPAQ